MLTHEQINKLEDDKLYNVSYEIIGRPFFSMNLGATQDPRSSLIGNTHFSKENGTFFAESLFVKAIQTPYAIILLDELSRAHPEAMNILMTVLDESQRYLRLDEADGAPTIQVANGVSFIATANIGNEYTATRVLDRALIDRFTIIEMEVLNAEEEKVLLKSLFPELQDRKIAAIAEIADATRKEIVSESSRIGTMISTRATVELAGLMNDGFTLAEAAEVSIFPFFDNSGGIDSERTYIKQVVQKFVDVDSDPDVFNVGSQANSSVGLSNDKPF
jgi:nitric oxide reductase NorQ protein